MKKPKLFISLLRIALGWVFLYQGVVAIRTADWSVLPFIKGAQTFPNFYSYISASPTLDYVSFLIKGIYILVGVLLILGLWARLASFFGIILMLFFYFPLLHFPYVGTSYYVVDEHIVFVLILAYLFVARAGEYFGLGTMFRMSRY